MRRAVVAGAFYERERDRLEKQLRDCFSGLAREPDDAIRGAVVPHAGYMYSGHVAASVYAKLPKAETFVILGVNHQGMGSPIAVSTERWTTPLGEVQVDDEFVQALPRRIIDIEETAHRYEHSIEVQLPFLQYTRTQPFCIVPISLGLIGIDTARELGEDLTATIAELNKRVIVLASSDFTHYEPDQIARANDSYVIEAIAELDVAKFYKRVYERNVTACGVDPIGVMLYTVKQLGATRGVVTKYETSGDITGDRRAVVGYGGIIIL
jgi:AmmeMemoRadiSam system protein B